jgi:hypothetical protein
MPPVDNRTTAGNDLITSQQPPAHIQACIVPAKKWHALESGQ